MLGELSIDSLSWGKKISMKGAQDLLALFKKKNNEKINMKKFFFSWKQGAALKLKTNRNYYPYEGLTSS